MPPAVEDHIIQSFFLTHPNFRTKAEELIKRNMDHQWVLEQDQENRKLILLGIDYEFGETERLTIQYEQNPH
tara:strand:- start:282 stop:497 length:216 start_codon:yes stop_codon:yes gene_type:complete